MAKRKMGVFRKAANLLAVALIVAGSWTQLAWAGGGGAEANIIITIPKGQFSDGDSATLSGTMPSDLASKAGLTCTLNAYNLYLYTVVDSAPAAISGADLNAEINVSKDKRYNFECSKEENGMRTIYGWSDHIQLNNGWFFNENAIAAPTNAIAEFNAPNEVVLTWTASPDADSYKISNALSTISEGSCGMKEEKNVTGTSATVEIYPASGSGSCAGLDTYAGFYIKSIKDGNPGEQAYASVLLELPPLAAGTLIKSFEWSEDEVKTGSQIPVSAILTQSATACWVQYYPSGPKYSLTISQKNGEKTASGTFTWYGENYKYNLYCQNAAGETEKSVEYVPVIGDDPILPPNVNTGPATPTNVKAIAQKDGSVKVSWTESADKADVKNYYLTYYETENGNSIGGQVLTPGTINYTISSANIISRKIVFITVSATDNNNVYSVESPKVAITPYNDIPTTPVINKYNGKQNPQTGDITITWTASTDADGIDHYKIEYGNEKKNSAEVAGDQTEFTIKNDGSFDFLMNCKNEKGEDSICLPVSLTAYDKSAQKLASETATNIFADVKIVAPIPQAPDTDNAQNTENAPQNTLEVASVGAPADGFGLKLNSAAMIMIFGGISALILANLTKMRKFANRK